MVMIERIQHLNQTKGFHSEYHKKKGNHKTTKW